MALRKRGKWWYGDAQSDIRDELVRYSTENSYVAVHFADAVCGCGGRVFGLMIDDNEGVAVRTCTTCDAGQHPIGDSAEYMEDAELQECACRCKAEAFEITTGVALYEGTEAVKWIYVGCRCVKCGLTGVFGDWKNEFEDYRTLLSKV